MENQLEWFAERLERAERQMRVLCALLIIMVVGLPILVSLKPGVTQAEDNKVKAPFCVVDDEGRALLRVERFNNGAARLALFNGGRRLRTVLLATEKGGDLWVLNNAGRPAASLLADEGGGHFGLCDNEGKPLPR